MKRHTVIKCVWLMLLIVASLAGQRAFAQKPTTKVDMDDEDNMDNEDIALFQTILAAELPGVKQPLIVKQKTVSGAILSELMSMFDSSKTPSQCPPELFKNLKIRNQHPKLLPEFSAIMPLIFVSEAEIDQMLKSGFWNNFYQKHPHTAGLASFALPSYNADKSAALIYFLISHGGLYGHGDFYYLEKTAGLWKIKRNLGGWIS